MPEKEPRWLLKALRLLKAPRLLKQEKSERKDDGNRRDNQFTLPVVPPPLSKSAAGHKTETGRLQSNLSASSVQEPMTPSDEYPLPAAANPVREATSAHKETATTTPPEQLCDQEYDGLKHDESELFETILSRDLDSSEGAKGNIIEQNQTGQAKMKLAQQDPPNIEGSEKLSKPPKGLYKPLDENWSEIQLLEIIHSDESELVECRLSTVSLLDNLSFTALSYVWGNRKVTKDILVNGYTIAVTVNLESALRRVRQYWQEEFPDRDMREFRIWVDAICINQFDTPERNKQVKYMRSIYSTAELIISWLGYGKEDTARAIETFKLISGEMSSVDSERTDKLSLHWVRKYPHLCDSGESHSAHDWWNAMLLFFDNTYFSRIWIFQEVVLGSRIIFAHGDCTIRYIDLEAATLWLFRIQDEIKKASDIRKIGLPVENHMIYISLASGLSSTDIFRRIVSTRKSRKDTSNTYDRVDWEIFPLCRSLEASDPKDHIYGLLGLSGYAIAPDYTQDVNTVFSTYVND